MNLAEKSGLDENANQQLSSENLIEALSSTETDMSFFASLADEEDDDGDSE